MLSMADRAEFIQNQTRSLGEILQDILHDFQEMVRAELRLAQAELSEKARKGAKSGMYLGMAAIAGFLAAASLVTCMIAALAIVIPVWASALSIGVLLGIFAGGLFGAGRQRLRRINPVPEQTVQTIREDVEWAKNRRK
jgi:uncharacterized membrane protein YqjE